MRKAWRERRRKKAWIRIERQGGIRRLRQGEKGGGGRHGDKGGMRKIKAWGYRERGRQ
jgi:hypothetical protein